MSHEMGLAIERVWRQYTRAEKRTKASHEPRGKLVAARDSIGNVARGTHHFEPHLAFAQRALQPAVEIVEIAQDLVLELFDDRKKSRRLRSIHDVHSHGLKSRPLPLLHRLAVFAGNHPVASIPPGKSAQAVRKNGKSPQ